MPAEDFVEHVIDQYTSRPNSGLNEATLNAKYIRGFLRDRAVIYPQFIERFVGSGDDDVQYNRLDEFRVKIWKESTTDEEGDLCSPNSEYKLTDMYSAVKELYNMCVIPTGLQYVNYISMLLRTVYIIKTIIYKEIVIPPGIDKAIKTLTKNQFEGSERLFKDLNQNQLCKQHFNDLTRRTDRLHDWKDQAVYRALARDLSIEVGNMCVNAKRESELSSEEIWLNLNKPQNRKERIYRVLTQAVPPVWLFRERAKADEIETVDIGRVTTLQIFDDLWKICHTKNTRTLSKILQTRAMEKNFRAMNTAIILSNQLTGDADLWVTGQCNKFWPEEKLSRSDFRNKAEVMLFFLQEIKQKKKAIDKTIATYFIAFLGELASFLKPIPNLEKAKTQEEQMEQFNRVVKEELRRDAPSVERQMAQAREQRKNLFGTEDYDTIYQAGMERLNQKVKVSASQKSDSGMVLPILLLAGAIFFFIN